jgi:Fe-S-cluster containining protein
MKSFFKYPLKIKITAKVVNMPFHGCTEQFITIHCKGRCCLSHTNNRGTVVVVHPSEEHKFKDYLIKDHMLMPIDKKCPFFINNFCSRHLTEDKPIGCKISPFTLRNNTLVIRRRNTVIKYCYNFGKTEPAYLAFKESLITLFGSSQTTLIISHFKKTNTDLLVDINNGLYSIIKDNQIATRKYLNKLEG